MDGKREEVRRRVEGRAGASVTSQRSVSSPSSGPRTSSLSKGPAPRTVVQNTFNKTDREKGKETYPRHRKKESERKARWSRGNKGKPSWRTRWKTDRQQTGKVPAVCVWGGDRVGKEDVVCSHMINKPLTQTAWLITRVHSEQAVVTVL